MGEGEGGGGRGEGGGEWGVAEIMQRRVGGF